MAGIDTSELEKVFITRREYDDKHIVLMQQVSEALGIVRTNETQIATLTAGLVELQKISTSNAKQIAVLSVYTKLLVPLVGGAIGIIGFLIGKL